MNVTSFRPGEVSLCVLEVGDHPDIRHKSRIAYEYVASTTTAAKLMDALDRGLMELREPISAELLQRIRAGAMASKDISAACQTLLRDQGCDGSGPGTSDR